MVDVSRDSAEERARSKAYRETEDPKYFKESEESGPFYVFTNNKDAIRRRRPAAAEHKIA